MNEGGALCFLQNKGDIQNCVNYGRMTYFPFYEIMGKSDRTLIKRRDWNCGESIWIYHLCMMVYNRTYLSSTGLIERYKQEKRLTHAIIDLEKTYH